MKTRLFLLPLVCATFGASAWAQRPLTQAQRAEAARAMRPDTEWHSAKWSAHDPFVAVRHRVEERMKRGLPLRTLDAIADNYHRQSEIYYRDAKAQYAWGLAALRQVQIRQMLTDGGMRDALQDMQATSQPHSFEYARLRFLLTMAVTPSVDVRSVGIRLYRKNPRDRQVNYYLVRTLDYKVPSDRKLADSIIATFIKTESHKPNTYYLAGTVNHRKWLATGNKAYADQSIAAYQKHMRMKKLDSLSVAQINFLINSMKTGRRSHKG